MMMLYLPSVVVVAARWRRFGCCGVHKCREWAGGPPVPQFERAAPRRHVAPEETKTPGKPAKGQQLALHDDQTGGAAAAGGGAAGGKLPAKSPLRSLPTAASGQREMRPLERLFATRVSRLVLRFWPAMLVVITPLIIVMAYVTLVSPKLSLPSTNEFQLFTLGQPMEQYDLNHKESFHSERSAHKMHLDFTFGAVAEDNGNGFDPDDWGSLVLAGGAAHDAVPAGGSPLSEPDAQRWLVEFCTAVPRASELSEYVAVGGWAQCWPAAFKAWMEGLRCNSTAPAAAARARVRDGCCAGEAASAQFPFPKTTFAKCAPMFASSEAGAAVEGAIWHLGDAAAPGAAGELRALKLKFEGSKDYTRKFDPIQAYKDLGDAWLSNQLDGAPDAVQGGFFTSSFWFFDLQAAIANGAYASFALSLALAFVVLLAATRNAAVSLMATVTVLSILLVVVGFLVLDGWKLNITESVTLAIAVGMSVDFTVHFGVSYLHSARGLPRAERVKIALTEMGVSVTVAAGTTLVAGVFMTFAQVLFYVQFGTFLALIMLFSWAFAVWYFMAMMAAAGPVGDAWQLDVWWARLCGGGGGGGGGGNVAVEAS